MRMNKRYICTVLGILVVFTALAGIPRTIKTPILVLLGIGIVGFTQERRKNTAPAFSVDKNVPAENRSS